MNGAPTRPATMSGSTTAADPARERPDWRDRAACRDADPDLFFPDDTRSARVQVKTAKLICAACPVSSSCLSWALSSGQEAGIWGGLTEGERRRLLPATAGWLAVDTGRGHPI